MKKNKKTTPSKKTIKEVSAGGVVFKRLGKRYYFAMIQDSYDKWTFPKGHVEKGEEIEETAARETLEEMGLQEIRLLEPLGKIDIWFNDRFNKSGALIHKDIHYFLFETNKDAKLYADIEQHVKAVQWVVASQVLKRISYKDMVPVFKRALEFIKES